MSHNPPFCQQCVRIDRRRVILERGQGPFLACPECGLVDESANAASTFVSVSEDVGAILDDNAQLQTKAYQTQYKLIKFEEGVTDLINLYLGVTNPNTSIIGFPAEHLRSGVRQWLQRLVEAESDSHKGSQRMVGASARRTKYFIVIAIKFAVQESALIVLDNRLEAKNIRRSVKTNLPGYVKGDEKLPSPTMMELFNGTQTLPSDHFGYLESYPYLSKLYRRYSRALSFQLSPIEYTLITLCTMVDRLRSLVSIPFVQRLSILATLPQTNRGPRDWTEDDFSFFNKVDWSLILPFGYRLFQAQECVRLWGNRTQPTCAIALTIWALQAEQKAVMPVQSAIIGELSAPYGTKYWTASERVRDMTNMLLAWSTSIADAGIPFPMIAVPPRGVLGNGIGGYNNDRNRPIPESEMAVAASPLVALYWPRIVRARLRMRKDAMSLGDELFLARKLFIISAAGHDKPGKKPRFGPRAMEAKKLLQTYMPLLRVRPNYIPFPSHQPIASASSSVRSSVSPAPSVSSHVSSIPFGPSPANYAPPPRPFIPPPPEQTIEDLLATKEDSSDEDDVGSSDEEATPRVPPTRGLGLENLGQTRQPPVKQPFSFTIGPQGFQADAPIASPPQRQSPLVHSDYQRSQTPVYSIRGSSVGSDVMPSSASEVEVVTSHWPRSTIIPGFGVASSPGSSQTNSPRGSLSPAPSSLASSSSMTRQPSHDSRGATPLRSMSSIPPPSRSRASSIASSSASAPRGMGMTLIKPRASDESHVGLLLRERDQYVQFRLAQFIEAGRIVAPIVEKFMWAWLRRQVDTGKMTSVITPEYLRSIGLEDDPRSIDLGPWIQSKSAIWSPQECLLRAGIKPKEFPYHFVPYSILEIDLQLNHYGSQFKAQLVQPVTNSKPSAEEMEVLFSKDTDEWDKMMMTAAEAKKRQKVYEKDGWWNDDEMGQGKGRGRKTSRPAQTKSKGKARASTRASVKKDDSESDSDISEEEFDYDALDRNVQMEGNTDDEGADNDSRGNSRAVSLTPSEREDVVGENEDSVPRDDIRRIITAINRNNQDMKKHRNRGRNKTNRSDIDIDGLEGLARAMREEDSRVDGSLAGGGGGSADGALEDVYLRDALNVGGMLDQSDDESDDGEIGSGSKSRGKRKRATSAIAVESGSASGKKQKKEESLPLPARKVLPRRTKADKGKEPMKSHNDDEDNESNLID